MQITTSKNQSKLIKTQKKNHLAYVRYVAEQNSYVVNHAVL